MANNSPKRGAGTDANPAPTKKARTEPMVVDEGADADGGVSPEQAARNKAFLEKVLPTNDHVVEGAEFNPDTMWWGPRYKSKTDRIRCNVYAKAPPPAKPGKQAWGTKMTLRLRGRLHGQWGVETKENESGVPKTRVKIEIDDVTYQNLRKVQQKMIAEQNANKWWKKDHGKVPQMLIDARVQPWCHEVKEKEKAVLDAEGNKIPDPEDPKKFLMESHDPKQYWAPIMATNVDFKRLKAENVKDQDGNVIPLDETLNGCAAILMLEIDYQYFMGADKTGLCSHLTGLRVNLEDRIEAGFSKEEDAGGLC